jgi:protein tyrosine phosphatase (PTP) superfamily phosphohydrolase (DUF442 family)
MNMAKRLLLILLLMAVLTGVEVGASELGSGAPLRPEVRAIPARGLNNAFALSTNLFSGAAPEGDEGFEALQKLGIKTIITVDGSAPDVEKAHAYGMRYIHLPHGYDGIPRATELELVKAVQTAEGPIYMHCHHGQHRGPAAAAVVCMATKGWSHEQGEAWLRTAGTGTNFQGLYATVRDFKQPSAAELEKAPAHFVEAQKPTGLVDSMVSVDETFDRIKSLRAIPSSSAPDNHLLNEATLLREHFREAQRVGDAKKRGADFVKRLSAAEAIATEFEQALSSSYDPATADRAFKQLSGMCAACHKEFRDPPLSAARHASPLPR